MRSEDDSNSILNQFKSIFSGQVLKDAFEEFEWGNQTAQEARDERDRFADKFSAWVKAGCQDSGAEDEIQAVHEWGFGKKLDERQRGLFDPPNFQAFCAMLKTWAAGSPKEARRAALEECLLIPHFGIARHSKWLCFIDQQNFAIYDSRVSLALRKIEIDGKRAFPTVGGRQANTPTPTALGKAPVAAERMSNAYMMYLDLLNAVKKDWGFDRVADIEMALFMLGRNEAYW